MGFCRLGYLHIFIISIGKTNCWNLTEKTTIKEIIDEKSSTKFCEKKKKRTKHYIYMHAY